VNETSPPAPLNHDGRLFLLIAIIVAVTFGAGGIFLILALNHHESDIGIKPDHPRQLVDFSLTDCTGRTVTRADLQGKILVVDFLLTSCSVSCPVVNRHMAEIQQLTIGQPDVRLLSLTVDPRTDTPASLMKYGARYGADTNRWFLLTGDKDTLYHLIATSFLPQDLDDPFVYMPGNFSHTERIALVDAHGHVQLYFDGMRRETTAKIVKEIDRLRKNDL
jgi:cytochrome oxidase Cu insertion factor (SCO1/SenC/PrrC family)